MSVQMETTFKISSTEPCNFLITDCLSGFHPKQISFRALHRFKGDINSGYSMHQIAINIQTLNSHNPVCISNGLTINEWQTSILSEQETISFPGQLKFLFFDIFTGEPISPDDITIIGIVKFF